MLANTVLDACAPSLFQSGAEALPDNFMNANLDDAIKSVKDAMSKHPGSANDIAFTALYLFAQKPSKTHEELKLFSYDIVNHLNQ